MLKSKKGFTLVELTIVMAVTAVVITMACVFMISYQKQSLTISKNSASVSDINKFKNTVNEWISTYDSKKYNNTVDGNAKQISVDSNNSKKLYVDTYKLEFDSTNKKLYTKSGDTVNKTIEFETISDCTFSKSNGMVYCTLTCNGKQVKLIFNIFSNSQRNRFSTVSSQN